ncbi:MAG TPA: UxaA family hydrolase [Deltaproteobacteria bacterium]|jgi:altronate dehydratase|nr:UxaA family hydrolase [Deltaproteobacteria bacterium]
MLHNVVHISPEDNVGVALVNIAKGEEIRPSSGPAFRAAEDIPYSHKVALEDIRAGGPVRKYGEEIGYARTDILKGGWVHTHNLEIREE